MTIVFILIWAFMIVLSMSAIGALIWAIQTRQFSNFQQGARTVFDEDEPEGEMTDFFPGEAPEGKSPSQTGDSK